MSFFLRWAKCYIKCVFYKGDFERFFNMCRYNNIEFWEMVWDNDRIYCKIYVYDFWKLKPLLKKTGVKIKVLERHGIRFVIHFLSKRMCLWIGLLFCIGGLLLLSSYIWKIDINGNSYYTDEQLLKYLNGQHKIGLGSKKSCLDLSELEEHLLIDFDNISWVSLNIQGTTLNIDLEETEKFTETAEKKEIKKDIYANKDGEILRVVIRSGTACINQGDQVKQGDLLIQGTIDYKDDAQNVIGKRWVGAEGEVYAKTTQAFHKVYRISKKSEKFDKELVCWKIVIGNNQFEIGKINDSKIDKADYYHISEFMSPLTCLKIQKEIYRPYEVVDSILHIMDAKQQAEKEMSDIYHEFIEKGVQIIENNVRIVMYEDRVEVKGSLVLNEPIGMFLEHKADPLETIENGELYEYNRNDN